MPRKSTRLDQCQFRESGQRCVRSGTGSPTLCRPHRIASEHAAKSDAPSRAPREGGGAFGELFQDFLAGRPFDPAKAASAINEFGWGLGGNYGGFSPDIDVDEPPPHGSRFDPPPDFHPPPRWGREPPPPPPPPRVDAEVQRARSTMGFGPGDPLSEDVIKHRRRSLARKHHPDFGGSTEKMKVVNDAADVLLASL